MPAENIGTPALKQRPSRLRRLRRWLMWGTLALIALTAIVLTIWIQAALRYTYSTGERTGYIQKVSRKGWLCKTWEGELAILSQPGTPPQIFSFSVRDDAAAQQVLKFAGQRVTVSYDQHVGLPTNCFGETQYFVTSVKASGP